MENFDFVTQFYNLEGDLISERKKNFYKLLKAQPVPLKEENLKDLCPRNYLERLFQIDIFIYFKLTEKILDVIKEGNEIFISKILKHPLLLKAAIGDISAEEFVNDFLPNTSYASRMKILKRISFFLGETQMDEIIFWVHKRYGLNIATKILHTCSSKKIREFLCNYEVKLKPRQIKFIFDKDPELFMIYLKHYKNLTGKALKHENLSKYIAQKQLDFWLKLYKEKEYIKSSVTLGRRTTKNIIHQRNSDILKNVEYYSEFLKLDIFVRKLHGSFKEVYFNLFPKNISKLNRSNSCFKLLSFYPKKKQWDLFEETFMRMFEKNIVDCLINLDSSFVEMFPQVIKNKWAEIHYDNDISKPNEILKFCDTKKAIPLFKEKINVTSKIYERTKLVELLVENCGRNNDLTSLEGVLQYIWIRHRNEDTISNILYEVSIWFKLEHLNENHWKYINEIIGHLRLKSGLRYNSDTFIVKHIEFLILNGKPFQTELATFLKDISLNYYSFRIELQTPEVKKQIFIEIINMFPEIPFGKYLKKEHVISSIINFNKAHPEYSIVLSSFSNVTDHIKFIIDKNNNHMNWEEKNILENIIEHNLKYPENPIVIIKESDILKIFRENSKDQFSGQFDKLIIKMITKSDRSNFENEVLQLFWENLWKYANMRRNVMKWLCVNEPKSLIPHIVRIFSQDTKCVDVAYLKLLSHLNLDKKVTDYCISKLKCVDDYLKAVELKSSSGDTKNPDSSQLNFDVDIITPLSILLTTHEYIEIVEKTFIPIKEKIETTDNLYKIYPFQCQVAECFKHLQEPVKVLPTLMKFCLGDYLGRALPSLYSVCYRAPENALYAYIDLLSKRAVSVRKHAIFLSCELLDFNYVVNMLQRTNESNLSSQKHMFSATLKYFCKNPCQELLEIVGGNINKIDKNDMETLNNLIKVKLPKKYTDFYIQKCWYFIESIEKDVDTQKYLESFLKSIISSEDIIFSSPDLCKHIVLNYFKEKPENKPTLKNIHHFVCTILRYQKTEATYNWIFDILSEFKRNQNMKPAKQLFEKFYRTALKDIKDNNKIDSYNNCHIELFKKYWFDIFTSTEMFDEYFLFNILYIKCKSYHEIEIYARDIVLYLEQVVAEYGPYIYDKIKKIMINQSYAVKDKYLFFYNILKFKISTLNCILILDLLENPCQNSFEYDDEYFYDQNTIEEFQTKILGMVKTSNDPVVKAYLNSYTNNK